MADNNGGRGFYVEYFMLDQCETFRPIRLTVCRAASAGTVIGSQTGRDVLTVDVVIPVTDRVRKKTTDGFNPKKTAAVGDTVMALTS